ncbi:hypothetical protein INTERNEXUS_68 [Bacillus phage vB_BspM_Internexus]|nr:hypothetical protein INTERNEXUS_68 [Bacillus phage vB_BspM_Internexus]
MLSKVYSRRLKDVYNNEFEVREYISSTINAIFYHKVCDSTFEMRPDSFFKKNKVTKCPICLLNKKHMEVVKKVKELTGDEYVVLGRFLAQHTKILFRHNKCGNEYKVQPYQFIRRGDRCPNCAKNKKRTDSDFRKKVEELVGNEYKPTSEYINNMTHVKMRHNKCGNEYSVLPVNFLSGYRCPNCAKTKKRTTETFKEKLYELVGNEYSLTNEYTHAHKHVTLYHGKCEKTFKIKPNNFILGYRCPHCSNGIGRNSSGIQIITNYFNQNNIYFEIEKSFSDLVNPKTGRRLRFDFYFEDEDGTKILVEYDGKQHFKPSDFFGGEEGLEDIQFRDNLKNEYCKRKGYKLFRFNYTQLSNLEEYLKKTFE